MYTMYTLYMHLSLYICICIYIYTYIHRSPVLRVGEHFREGDLWERWVVVVPFFEVLQFDILAKNP